MDSTQYGEKWARHWLDSARYADSNGFTIDSPREMWKYRDWVIDSFNEDKPYNRFVAEQIAGDLLPAKTVLQRRDQIVGTGMLALGSMNVQEGDYEQYILDQVDDQIDVVGRAFLGLTLAWGLTGVKAQGSSFEHEQTYLNLVATREIAARCGARAAPPPPRRRRAGVRSARRHRDARC